MPDWTVYDPQLRQFAAEGVSQVMIAKRLGLPRQTVRDRLKKLGLKPSPQFTPAKVSPAPQEKPTSDDTVEVLPGQISIEDADTPTEDAVSPIGDIIPVAEMTGPLSPAEVQTLAHYEQIIDQGIKTFVQVGNALLTIREERLYRETYTTFETYLRERWNLDRSYAYRMIDAAHVVENLLPIGDILPVNESQTRPLTSLPAEQQVVVWQEAVKTAPAGKVTAAHVKNTVKRLKPGTTTPKATKPKAPEPETRPAARMRLQNGLFAVLSMVRDDDAWTLLGELILLVDSYAERQSDAEQQQRMEQALSPLWHLVDAHRADE